MKKKKKRGKADRDTTHQPGSRDSLWELKYFVAVAETGSIKKGAERAGKKASPMSSFIWNFEHNEVGVDLFVHRGNAVTLTKAGKLFLSDARKILRAYNDATRRARASVGIRPSKIHVGYPGSPANEILEPAIKLYVESSPGTEVVRHRILVPDCFHELLSGELDLALVVEPKRTDSRLKFTKLTDYPVRCVLGRKHRMFSQPFVRADELKDEMFLIFKRRDAPQYYRYLCDWFERHGFTPRVCDDYDDLETLLPAVAGGYGVAMLLSPAEIDAHRLDVDVSFLPLQPEFPRTNVGVLFLPPLMEHSSKFVAAAKECIAKKAENSCV